MYIQSASLSSFIYIYDGLYFIRTMPCMDLKRLMYTFGYEKVKIESEKVKQKEGGREGENRTRWENRSYYKYAMVDGKRENLSGGGLLIQLIVLSCFLLLYFMELSNYFSKSFPLTLIRSEALAKHVISCWDLEYVCEM